MPLYLHFIPTIFSTSSQGGWQAAWPGLQGAVPSLATTHERRLCDLLSELEKLMRAKGGATNDHRPPMNGHSLLLWKQVAICNLQLLSIKSIYLIYFFKI